MMSKSVDLMELLSKLVKQDTREKYGTTSSREENE